MRARVDGRRGPALHPLHVGHHGETQGHHAHDGWISDAGRVHPQVRVRSEARLRRPTGVQPSVGWVTGHSLHRSDGPLANRARPSVLYEGTPDHPGKDRLWSIVEKYKVTIFYTAPTAIKNVHEVGLNHLPAGHDLSSLRVIGTVGEPINPEAWVWYYGHIGRERCPVVDTWWQTETGAIMISVVPGRDHAEAGERHLPAARGSRQSIVRTMPGSRSASPVAGISCCRARGRRCSAASAGGRPGALPRPTGPASTASTSRATAPSATTTVTSGSWVGSTTSCSSPVTTSRPPRSSPRWSSPRSRKPGRRPQRRDTGQAIAVVRHPAQRYRARRRSRRGVA